MSHGTGPSPRAAAHGGHAAADDRGLGGFDGFFDEVSMGFHEVQERLQWV